MKGNPMRGKTYFLVVFLVLWFAAAATSQAWAGSPLPLPVKPYGMSYQEWSAKWWQWALSLPIDQNPFFDEQGACANGANG